MKYDPKLKECLTRMRALCAEYDCGAYVMLVSPTHGEFQYILPKWAALYEILEHGETVGIRITCKKEEKEKAELTAHFIQSGRDIAAAGFQFFDGLCKETEKFWKTEHVKFSGFVPHRKDVQ